MIHIPRLRVRSRSQLGENQTKRTIKLKSIPWTILTRFQAVIQTRIVTTLKSLESAKRDRKRRLSKIKRRKTLQPQRPLLHLFQLKALEWLLKQTELSTPMSQLLLNNNLQLPRWNPTTTTSFLTSSAVRNLLLNSSLTLSDLWINNSSHRVRLIPSLVGWRLTIAQSTLTIINLPSLNQISNNKIKINSSSRRHLLLWIIRLNRLQRLLLKHLHRTICSAVWICPILDKLNSPNKFNNLYSNNSLSLQLNPICGTTAPQINCSI